MNILQEIAQNCTNEVTKQLHTYLSDTDMAKWRKYEI